MNIWEELRIFGINCGYSTFETTLLGPATSKETETGELTGYIPPDLQYDAIRNGLVIEAALFERGVYVIRLQHIAPQK